METLSFKQILQNDIKQTFLNLEEFAERRTVKYHGQVYEDIPVMVEGPAEEPRDQLITDDHVRGLHLITAILHCAQEDMGGRLPEQGKTLEINTKEGGTFFRKYRIAASIEELGMFRIELEVTKQ